VHWKSSFADFWVLPAWTTMSSGMQVAASRNTALCSIPSGPKMKFVNALWVTTGWPEWPVWVRSTVAVAYFGEKFLSPAKVKSMSRPVAVSPSGAPPLGASTSAGPLTRSSEMLAEMGGAKFGRRPVLT